MSENFFENPAFVNKLRESSERTKMKANEQNMKVLDVIDDELDDIRTSMGLLVKDSIYNIKKRKLREKYGISSYSESEFDDTFNTGEHIATASNYLAIVA